MGLNKICAHPGCKEISRGTRCPTHTKALTRTKNGRRSQTVRKQARKQLDLNGGGFCYLCQNWFPPTNLQIDHVVALEDGGTDAPSNMAPACRPCHHTKTVAENQRRRLLG